tara:strand:- start:785 stop:1168 length:384 start_codon:yes stop_codon:yes gene_type:complete
MNTSPKFFQAAVNQEQAQEAINAQVDDLSIVLQQGDVVATLDWVAEFATLTSRISDPESLNLRFDDVISQLENAGYGGDNDHGAHSIIANTMGRMKDGLVPTGYERIFADKYKAELDGGMTETADIA